MGRRLPGYLRCIRFKEVLLLQGSPAFGLALAFEPGSPDALRNVLLFFSASSLLVAHVFAFNDWSDINSDRRDRTKRRQTFREIGVSDREIASLSFYLAAGSLFLFAFLPTGTFLLALGTLASGLVYSSPRIRAKEIPIVSSFVHLIGGLQHFLAGYSLFRTIGAEAVLTGLYFSMVFAAGHLAQEVRDYSGDRYSKVRTSAVFFGRRRVLAASFLLFSASYGYLCYLSYMGMFPEFFLLVVIMYPFQACLFWRIFRKDFDYRDVKRFQLQYRVIFGLAGVMMMAGLIEGFWGGAHDEWVGFSRSR